MKRVVRKFSIDHVPKLDIYRLKKINLKNSEFSKIQSQINPEVAKWSFVLLVVLLFFTLFYQSPAVTSFSILDTSTVYPGLNFVIFFSFLALVFFLTYEKKKKLK